MGALVWFAAAALLAALELAVGELTLLMLAAGALTTAVAALAGISLTAEVVVFAVASAGFWFFLRPYLRRRLDSPPVYDESPRALVGSQAQVVEEVTGSTGQVLIDGSLWSARCLDPGETIAPGERATVSAIDGPVAVVWKEK